MMLTPEQMRDRLLGKLNLRRREIIKRRRYYDGEHLLPMAPDDDTDEYKRLAVLGQANLCANVVDAVVEGLVADGVNMAPGRPGEASADDDDPGLMVWLDYLQPAGIDALLPCVFEESTKTGWAMMLVWPEDPPADADDSSARRSVSITAEDPMECIVEYAPGSRRKRIAALKVYRDDVDGRQYLTLWYAGRLHFWVSKGQSPVSSSTVATQFWLSWGGPDAGEQSVESPLGAEIPMIEFRCRPKLNGDPQPELSRSVLICQDRLNFRLFNSVVVGEYQSYPQRVAIGLALKLDANGDPINPLKAGPERVWLLDPDPESGVTPNVTQLASADLRQHIDVVRSEVQMMAAISKTPIYSLAGDLVNVSADTISALSEGRLYKIRRHQLEYGEALEDVVRVTLLAAGMPDLAEQARRSEVLWASPELLTLQQRSDAAVKLDSIDEMPFEVVLETLGFTKTRIAEVKAMSASSRLLDAIGAAAGTPDPADLKLRVDAMGVLIRAGVTPASAAERVGLDGVEFIPGALPVTISVPDPNPSPSPESGS